MFKIVIIPALFVALTACGSDGGSAAEPAADTAADTTAPSAATTNPPTTDTSTPDTAAPDAAPEAATCDGALGEAEGMLVGVMDDFDAGETVDLDEIDAAFNAIGTAVGTNCFEDTDSAVSRLITFTSDEAADRSTESQDFALGFVTELCEVPLTLSPSAADACAATEG